MFQYKCSPISPVPDIPLSERQGLMNDQLSPCLMFFDLPLSIGPYDKGLPY